MKKFKLISLSLMMLLCMSSISQTVTQKKQTQSTLNKVVIDTSIARRIAIDLVKGDVCKEEIKLVRDNFNLAKKEVIEKDSIIKTMKVQEDKLNLIISKKDDLFSKQEEISKTYKKEGLKEKRKSTFYKVIAIITTSTSLMLFFKP